MIKRSAFLLLFHTAGKSDEGGFFKTYGSDADGTKGYVKETFGKGDHGYKNLDTFHKQDGDNYGFEKHTSFGHGKEGKKGRHVKMGAYSKKEGDHEGSGKIFFYINLYEQILYADFFRFNIYFVKRFSKI